ncbi:hypothetical protein [Enterococcus gilvus]|uniref:Uncharacterized protein n=1 Tax=Enterococcus gilvus ATCC BAA-350 TaxID=1158614 RepID=R2XKH2_9ENTE|nr:hypothetical protein [Enterococcus gilvus]EOI55439.1 hypothetical protein UKC_02647 [Enterococcus gilvus ATCC BAA-350]EOW82018.1 hypothetical protein I592_01319 [Enterococcus gilvus ATCC BAA-350]
MSKRKLTEAEIDQLRIEIELKRLYYGSFVSNVLNARQAEKMAQCERDNEYKKTEFKK